MIKKVLLATILLLAVLYNLTVIYIDNTITKKIDESVYSLADKIWVARGLYNTHAEQNSIESMNRAFNEGAKGVEVDFYYDVDMNRFIVSHDRPKTGKDSKLIYTTKNGELLTLEKLFIETGTNHYFWLDYKNLDRLTSEQTAKALKRLQDITKFDSIKDRVYIEGSNPLRVSLYTDAGFKTILAVRPLPQENIFATISANLFKIAYYFSNITALAISYGDVNNPYYGEKAQESLKNIPVFLFHVADDENLLYDLVKKEDVRVMLVGRDQSINRFYINALNK